MATPTQQIDRASRSLPKSEHTAALNPASDSRWDALRTTADYVRRHPFQIMCSVAAAGFVISKLFKSRAAETIADEFH
jgi:hypothetical protein